MLLSTQLHGVWGRAGWHLVALLEKLYRRITPNEIRSSTRQLQSAIHAWLGKPRAFCRASSLNFRLLTRRRELWLVTGEGKRYREAVPRSVKLFLPWKLSN